MDLEEGIGIDDRGVDGAVATVADIDIAGDGGIRVLDVVGPARVGVIRERGMGIRVGIVLEIAEGEIESPCDLRLGVVWDEEGGFVQREAEGIILFVGVISDRIDLSCSVFNVVVGSVFSIPGPIPLFVPGPGGRIVILFTTLGEPGTTPGSLSWNLGTYHQRFIPSTSRIREGTYGWPFR